MSGLSRRRLTGEILDGLAPEDPRAIRSRQELRRLNIIMRQHAILEALLRTHVRRPPRRILEIGGGDGRFMLALARRLARRWPGVEVTLVDLADCVAPRTWGDFAAEGWTLKTVAADVSAWSAATDERFDAVIVNLVLHHFDDQQLARLFASVARLTPVFVATEPRRTRFALLASRMVWALGANAVTRHDAPASVRAGFRERELSTLWPEGACHTLAESRRGLFTHAFAAERPVS